MIAGREPRDGLAAPFQRAVRQQRESPVQILFEAAHALRDRGLERMAGGGHQRPRFAGAEIGIGPEAETVEPADQMAFDHDLVAVGDARPRAGASFHATHEMGVALIDEALCQRLVQRIRQAGPRRRACVPASRAASASQSTRLAT